MTQWPKYYNVSVFEILPNHQYLKDKSGDNFYISYCQTPMKRLKTYNELILLANIV